MNTEELAGTNVVRRKMGGPDFILSNSIPLHRSSTFESNGRDGPDTKRLRRSNSSGILRENRQARLTCRSAQHQLRLPSFEALGISARFSRYSPFTAKPNLPHRSQDRSLSPPPISPRTPDVLPRSTGSAPTPSTSQFLCPTHGITFPLTPPDEKPALDFPSQSEEATLSQSTCPSHLNTSSHIMSGIQGQGIMTVTYSGDAPTSSTAEGYPAALDTMPEIGGALPTALNEQNETVSSSLLEDGINASVSTIGISGIPGDMCRILSQTLPCPPTESTLEESAPFSPVYVKVVEAIQARLQPGKSPYVDITHAMPPKSTLSSLPQSPPSTPGFPNPQGEDYFSTNIFSRAAPVPSYHDSHGLLNASAPFSPTPLVPPSSIHVACIERYIPPSSVQEANDLLSATGPSVLLDRLIELSSNGGNLIILMPTKTGALTFKNEYLGPILEPLLRHIITVNSLSSDVASSLGKMSAVDAMLDFEGLKRKLNTICRRLNRQPPSPSSPNPHSANPGEYTLVHASTGVVPLARSLWSEWWVVQEQQRIKDVLSLYWRAAQRLPVDKAVTSSSLWRNILEGVKKRAYEEAEEPSCGVEMGVFVIRRVK